ncbi:THUMP-like domain-containing protein [Maribacter dokdonensis]|uniref:THUMP-like domain-containing protein n=1 Tax=Maribacter dokdonensis TaxID=320912 RepID=UPI0027344783|nr:RsmD family RNA methyltransferase [Maribacter dokdonensis]MDP2527725.1 RsmD family RNA methyltransferase [Maribacter dokdonensis]
MNSEIVTDEVQQYITDKLGTDVHKILLSKPRFTEVSPKELVEQIESKTKAKAKLPSWFSTKNIYYPNKLNLSQTSSEVTAQYKASLINGKSIVDITGGFGVDAYSFSQKFEQVTHVEKNNTLSNIAQHNFEQMGATNINCIASEGLDFLKASTTTFNWIYIDPSRRDKNNKKVYYLSDCEPNIVNQTSFLFTKANNVLVKTGPLLDLKIGLTELSNVKEIHIVAINNDVKEVLWLMEKGYNQEPIIKTINFKNSIKQEFSFKPSDEENALSNFSKPQNYLYEPNAAILKSGSFQFIGAFFKLNKLHPNSHLFTSTELIKFPGRVFKIESIYEYSKKSFKKSGIKKANITTRNFPDSVSEIRRKLGLKDGGENYVFATTDLNGKLMLISCFRH